MRSKHYFAENVLVQRTIIVSSRERHFNRYSFESGKKKTIGPYLSPSRTVSNKFSPNNFLKAGNGQIRPPNDVTISKKIGLFYGSRVFLFIFSNWEWPRTQTDFSNVLRYLFADALSPLFTTVFATHVIRPLYLFIFFFVYRTKITRKTLVPWLLVVRTRDPTRLFCARSGCRTRSVFKNIMLRTKENLLKPANVLPSSSVFVVIIAINAV